MKEQTKKAIAAKLAGFCRLKGSASKAANALTGVSSATISQIQNKNWEQISDEMWRKVAAQIGYTENQWIIAETVGYRKMYRLLQESQDSSLVMGVIGDAGCGKTQAMKSYCATHRNAYHLCCSEYWNRKQFLYEVAQGMGISFTGSTVSVMVSDVILALNKKDHPLLILDEADKLSDQVLYFFITLYNNLEDQCGILMAATDYFAKRITFGERISKKGYKEIYSRLGRKFITIPIANRDDARMICTINGVTEESEISRIVEDSERDLRRVKRLVHAYKRSKEDADNESNQ